MPSKKNKQQKKSKKSEENKSNKPEKSIETNDHDGTDDYVPLTLEERAEIGRVVMLATLRQMDLDGMEEADEKSKKCLGHVSFLLRDNENFQTYEMDMEDYEKSKRMEDLEENDGDAAEVKDEETREMGLKLWNQYKNGDFEDERKMMTEERRELGLKLWNQYKNGIVVDDSEVIDGDAAEVEDEETRELLWNQYKMKQETFEKYQMMEDSEVIDGEEADVKDEQLPELTIDE